MRYIQKNQFMDLCKPGVILDQYGSKQELSDIFWWKSSISNFQQYLKNGLWYKRKRLFMALCNLVFIIHSFIHGSIWLKTGTVQQL
jgi:hypothetical protein